MIKKSDIANYLTYSRIIAIPLIIILLLAENEFLRILSLILYIIAAITDFFDGYLARKWGTTSPIGQMLDPIADKLLVAALLLCFAFDRTFTISNLIAAMIILMREIFIAGLREYLGNQKIILKVSILAKYKTTIQLIALGLFFIVPISENIKPLADILLWLAAIITIITGYNYWRATVLQLKN